MKKWCSREQLICSFRLWRHALWLKSQKRVLMILESHLLIWEWICPCLLHRRRAPDSPDPCQSPAALLHDSTPDRDTHTHHIQNSTAVSVFRHACSVIVELHRVVVVWGVSGNEISLLICKPSSGRLIRSTPPHPEAWFPLTHRRAGRNPSYLCLNYS